MPTQELKEIVFSFKVFMGSQLKNWEKLDFAEFIIAQLNSVNNIKNK